MVMCLSFTMVLFMCGMVTRADIIHVMRSASLSVVSARCGRVARVHRIHAVSGIIVSSWISALGAMMLRANVLVL